MPQGQLHSIVPIIITVLLVGAAMAWRLRRMNRARPLKLELLWVTPAIFIALGALVILARPPHGIAWIYIAVSLAVGGAFGWWRGKLMRISVDPQSHAISVRASLGGVVFILAIVVIRYALRGAALSEVSVLHLSIILITDISMAFAVGLIAVQRVEMFRRAKRLFNAARAVGTAAIS